MKFFAVLLVIVSLPISSIAGDVYCTGVAFFYKDGFGKDSPLKIESGRIVSINTKTKALTIESAIGEKLTVPYLDDSKIISAQIPLHTEMYGNLVDTENISIEKSTGKIKGTFVLTDKQTYSAFEGKCKKAEKSP
jgi:hypothetical protein